MTKHKLGDALAVALKIAGIVALLGSPVAAYVAATVKIGIIEYKLDEYAREMQDTKRAVEALRLTDKDLVATDALLAQQLAALKSRKTKP